MFRIVLMIAVASALLMFMFVTFDRQNAQPVKIVSDAQSNAIKQALKP